MRASQVAEFGPPSSLLVGEIDDPEAGIGRIHGKAAVAIKGIS